LKLFAVGADVCGVLPTGKHNVKGPGTYICKFNQSRGACDWQGEAD
jgi:hypothetical protein